MPDDHESCQECPETPVVLIQDITGDYDPEYYCKQHDPRRKQDDKGRRCCGDLPGHAPECPNHPFPGDHEGYTKNDTVMGMKSRPVVADSEPQPDQPDAERGA